MGSIQRTLGVSFAILVLLLAAGACNKTPASAARPGGEEAADRTGVTEDEVTPPAPSRPAKPRAAAEEAPAQPAAAKEEAPAAPAAAADGACSPVGRWDESWKGVAAADGKELSGASSWTVTDEGGALKVLGADKRNPLDTWSGSLEVTGRTVVVDFVARDRTYTGRYTCELAEEGCAAMDCTVTAKNQNGTPNMTGRASLTRGK